MSEELDSHFIPPSNLVSKDSKLIIDLGCNVGETTLYYAENYPQAKIYAVELDEEVAKSAQLKVSDYRDRVFVYSQAIGWPEGILTAYIDTISTVSSLTPYQGRYTRERLVNVVSLDTFLEREVGKRKIDFIKIDIEGAELQLLESTRWMERTKVFIVECHSEEAIQIFLSLNEFKVTPLYSAPEYRNHLIGYK